LEPRTAVGAGLDECAAYETRFVLLRVAHGVSLSSLSRARALARANHFRNGAALDRFQRHHSRRRVGDRDVVVGVHLSYRTRHRAARGQPHQQLDALRAGLLTSSWMLNCVAHSGSLTRLSMNF